MRLSCVTACVAALAWTAGDATAATIDFEIVHHFKFLNAVGDCEARPLLASDGNFYIPCLRGGDAGLGAIVRMSPDGAMKVLHSFSQAEGFAARAGLIEGPDGKLYGTTDLGGTFGGGTIFRISRDGEFESLHSFAGSDGASPYAAGLVLSERGDFYGATFRGGVASAGTVFKLAADGTFSKIFDFPPDDLRGPNALLLAPDGNLYGTTFVGGVGDCGGVYKLSTDGTHYRPYFFHPEAGCNPQSAPIVGSDGNLYGTATQGGLVIEPECFPSGCGTIWRFVSGQGQRAIHRFHVPDGLNPEAALLQASDGNLYGTAEFGGTGFGLGSGTIFRIGADGVFTTLLRLHPWQGIYPVAPLVEAPGGYLYGLTSLEGGPGGDGGGTFFRISAQATLAGGD
jgi:uncharacterized repeat protein (TIGR03803 family)